MKFGTALSSQIFASCFPSSEPDMKKLDLEMFLDVDIEMKYPNCDYGLRQKSYRLT